MALDLLGDLILRLTMLLVSIGVLIYVVFSTPLHPHEQTETAFVLLSLGWVLSVVLAWLSQRTALVSLAGALSMLSMQVLAAVVTYFLLVCAGIARTSLGKVVWGLSFMGLILIVAGLGWGDGGAVWASAWSAVTLAAIAVAAGALLWRMKLVMSPNSCLLALEGLWGLGLAVDALWLRAAPGLQVMHFLYFACLVGLGCLLSGRVDWSQPYRTQSHKVPQSYVSHSGFSGMAETQSAPVTVAMAIEHERSRIAQDIHDGVGSQLVGLIASLDPKSLQDKRILMGLESCLLDLKMTVDSMNHTDTNIFDALGRLRYRLQPSFERGGIKMLWRVEVAGPLVNIPMAEVSHLVHIVQECFSNILQHSQATKIKLVCRYEPEPEPRLRLEVQDNGVGISPRDQGEFVGKGMANMLRRAKLLGVPLHIGTQVGVGTRVRLYLPVRSASAIAQA